jgi:hypothetical protein
VSNGHGDATDHLLVSADIRSCRRGAGQARLLGPLIVERTFAGGVGRTDRFAISLESVSGFIGGDGFESRTSSRWEGNRLVITTSTGHRAELSTEHTESWELDPAGMLVITTTDRDAVSASRSTKLTYRRN